MNIHSGQNRIKHDNSPHESVMHGIARSMRRKRRFIKTIWETDSIETERFDI